MVIWMMPDDPKKQRRRKGKLDTEGTVKQQCLPPYSMAFMLGETEPADLAS